MAGTPGQSDGCHVDRRTGLHRARTYNRLSALGHLSHPRSFGDEPWHIGFRSFLVAAPVEDERSVGIIAHCSAGAGLRLAVRWRSADRPFRAHARAVSDRTV